jgi:hypothetical protein
MEKLSNVDRWLERSCGSKATRDRYARALEIFSEKYGVDPEVLIEQWKQSRYDWKLRNVH